MTYQVVFFILIGLSVKLSWISLYRDEVRFNIFNIILRPKRIPLAEDNDFHMPDTISCDYY